MKYNERKINALFNLVDDNDEDIIALVKAEIEEHQELALELIDDFILNANDPKLLKRLNIIKEELHVSLAIKELRKWQAKNDRDLASAIEIITALHFKSFEKNSFREAMTHLINAFWLEINPRMNGIEKIRSFNRLFFNIFEISEPGFGNLPHFNFPHISLEEQKGSIFSLALIYTIVAQELNIPVYILSPSINDIYLGYLDEENLNPFVGRGGNKLLFYIDLAEQGKIKTELDDTINFHKVISHTEVIRQYLCLLILSYHKWHFQVDKVAGLEEMLFEIEKS